MAWCGDTAVLLKAPAKLLLLSSGVLQQQWLGQLLMGGYRGAEDAWGWCP